MIRFTLFLALFVWGVEALSATCEAVFPNAAQNSRNSGEVILQFNSRLQGMPTTTVSTNNLVNNSGGVGCNGGACTEGNVIVPTGNFNSFPTGQPDVILGFQQTQTISPGNYGNILLGTEAILTVQPGTYVVRGTFTMQFQSQLVVNGPGTVTFLVRGDITFNSSASANQSGSGNYLAMYTRDDIFIRSSAQVNAVLYARDDITMDNGASVTGAVTARDDITLNSASTITYDANAVSGIDFGSVCTQPAPPVLIAHWRLDEAAWTGGGNEVVDSSGNGLNGFVVNNGGLPVTDQASPAIPGNPGTCRYGNFNGTADGYVQTNDPGTNSILDLDSSFSVTTWIYVRSLPSSDLMTIVSKDENFEFHLDTSGRIFWWWGGGNRALTSTTSITLNTWHHVAITYQSGRQIIYLDGVNIGQHNSADAITVNNDGVFIGTDLAFHSRRFDGFIDEVRIYDGALSSLAVNTVRSETHACVFVSALDHFTIDVGTGSASVCAPQAVTITARDSLSNVLTSYDGTVGVATSTSNGNWSVVTANGTMTPDPHSVDDGAVGYTFDSGGADAGSIVLNLDNQHAENLTITVSDSTAGVSSTSSALNFSRNAFVVSSTDSLGDDIVAGRQHDFQLAMWLQNTDGSMGAPCRVAENYNGSRNLKAWLSRSVDDPNGTAPILNDGVPASISLPDVRPGSNNVTLGFVNGLASFTLDSSDVGQYAMSFVDDSLSFSALEIASSSPTYTARPFGFELAVAANPAAETALGTVFVAAGASFTLTATARAWSASDDGNDDGIPDIYMNVATSDNSRFNGIALQRFGREGAAESLTLSHQLLQPSAGVAGSLTLVSAPSAPVILSGFSNGSASTNLSFSEVGIIQINAAITDGNYLGAGVTNTSRSNSASRSVGRFTPSYLTIDNASASIAAACSVVTDYSYMGQAFTAAFDVLARNTNNIVTQNYEGAFQKLDGTLGRFFFGAIDAAALTSFNTRLSHSETVNWSRGTGAALASLTVARASTPDGAYGQVDVGVDFQDADNVPLRAADFNLDTDNNGADDRVLIDQTDLRFGRLTLIDAYGPESANLPVTFVTEYWDGRAWVLNQDDSCSAIAQTAISYPSGPISVLGNRDVVVGSGSTTGTYGDDSGMAINFSAGDAGHFFTAPGAGNTGVFNVDVSLVAYPWLRFDWNQDGDYSDSALPTATFSFGSYRAHDRIIFWQEVLRN